MNKFGKALTKFDDAIWLFFSKKWHYAITVPGLLVLLYALYFLFCFRGATYDTAIAGYQLFGLRNDTCFTVLQWLGVLAVVLLLVYILLEIAFGMMKKEKLVRVIFVLSCICLVCYGYTMSVQAFGQRYDMLPFEDRGHWAIISELYLTGKVPAAKMDNQYYHPKLFHIVMYAFMKFNSLFIHLGNDVAREVTISGNLYQWTVTDYQLMEMNRIFMAYIGIWTLVALKRIMKLILKGGTKYAVGTSFLLMIPGLWYIPFYGNNDSLSFFFSLFALYFALLFYQKGKWYSLILSALSIGLGMMTKTNAVLVAIPIAALFALKLLSCIKEKERKALGHFFLQMGVFALIVFPLGLWCPIYYKTIYGIPFGYVLENEPGNVWWINQDFYNPFQRFIAFPALDLFRYPYVSMRRPIGENGYYDSYGTIDYNVWTGYVKSLCFYGQTSPTWLFRSGGSFAPLQLLWLMHMHFYYYFLILIFVIAIVASLFFLIRKIVITIKEKGKRFSIWLENEVPILLIVISLTYIVGYIYFNWRYPFGVTQHSRYALVLLVPVFSSLGCFCEYLSSRVKKRKEPNPQ